MSGWGTLNASSSVSDLPGHLRENPDVHDAMLTGLSALCVMLALDSGWLTGSLAEACRAGASFGELMAVDEGTWVRREGLKWYARLRAEGADHEQALVLLPVADLAVPWLAGGRVSVHELLPYAHVRGGKFLDICKALSLGCSPDEVADMAELCFPRGYFWARNAGVGHTTALLGETWAGSSSMLLLVEAGMPAGLVRGWSIEVNLMREAIGEDQVPRVLKAWTRPLRAPWLALRVRRAVSRWQRTGRGSSS